MKTKKLGQTKLESVWSNTTVADKVESWNWNAGVFEIYDEIRDWNRRDQHNVLKFAYEYFNKDVFINELASHLLGEGFSN